MHPNTRFASSKGKKYNTGPYRYWNVDTKSYDLDIPLAALNLEEPRNGIGNSSYTPQSTTEHVSCSFFYDEDKVEDNDYWNLLS